MNLKRVSGKGIKLAVIAKKDKIISKAKVMGVKTKVGYDSLNIDEKVEGIKKVSPKKTWKNLVFEWKKIFFRPVRQVSHIGLVVVVMIVLATSIPAPKVASSTTTIKPVDPFGAQAMLAGSENAGDKVTAVEAVAAAVSVIDTSPENKLSNEAFQIADEKAAKASLAVSGDALLSLSPVSTNSTGTKAGFQKYAVQNGDTLWTIAKAFGITTDSIKWSNNMSDADYVKPGQELLIPSITGIIYTVKSGDTIEGIASRYKSSADMVVSQNNLWGEEIKVGMKLIIPDGSIDEPAPAPSRTQIAGRAPGPAPAYVEASAGPNRFPWGYCTWWVAHKRYIPWNGNAWQWYGNGIAYGRTVGRTPVPGAVMVTWESSVGHVAYVESVSGNTFTVSEMNYAGWGRVSYRTITVGQVPLIGFIY